MVESLSLQRDFELLSFLVIVLAVKNRKWKPGNVNVFIYCTFHWRFTILLWSEIGRQHVKASLAAAISPYFYLTSPRMNVKDR